SLPIFRLIVPHISRLDPKGAPAGATLNLEGNNFGTKVEDVAVLFGKEKATILTLAPKSIQVKVPALPTEGKSVPVLVTVRGMKSTESAMPLPSPPEPGVLDWEGQRGPFSQIL